MTTLFVVLLRYLEAKFVLPKHEKLVVIYCKGLNGLVIGIATRVEGQLATHRVLNKSGHLPCFSTKTLNKNKSAILELYELVIWLSFLFYLWFRSIFLLRIFSQFAVG